MGNARELKSRIKSVRDTKKITNAMYLIASIKMQKARRNLERSRSYFDAIRKEIVNVFRCADDVKSPYFFQPEKMENSNKPPACLVITADKGLAGSYNANVIKKLENLLGRHPDTKLFVLGDYGRHHMEHYGIEYEHGFRYHSQTPTMEEAREIAEILIDYYDRGVTDRIYILYTNMKTALTSEPEFDRLLPFHRGDFMDDYEDDYEEGRDADFEFIPSADMVLTNALRSLLTGYIYSGLVYSFCAEQNARMQAMDSANKNAEKILGSLTLQYNRARQAAITQEITEICAGAMAQKRKRLKKQMKETVLHD